MSQAGSAHEHESLLPLRPMVYEIQVCCICRASLDWCADDGEGMWPRAWCRGPERHLVIDDPDKQRDLYPLTIHVVEVYEV